MHKSPLKEYLVSYRKVHGAETGSVPNYWYTAGAYVARSPAGAISQAVEHMTDIDGELDVSATLHIPEA